MNTCENKTSENVTYRNLISILTALVFVGFLDVWIALALVLFLVFIFSIHFSMSKKFLLSSRATFL